MTRRTDFRLCLVTDRTRCAPRSLESVIEQACAAGVRAAQLREKDLSEDDFVVLARNLSVVTRKYGAKLLVNAHNCKNTEPLENVIDGLHAPEGIEIPSQLRSKLLLGASTHSLEGAIAIEAQFDYVFFGPVFDTPSKTAYGPPQGLDRLKAVARAVSIPVFAIGGVTPERARACLDAGAHGVAAVGAIMGARDVASSVDRFEKAMGSL